MVVAPTASLHPYLIHQLVQLFPLSELGDLQRGNITRGIPNCADAHNRVVEVLMLINLSAEHWQLLLNNLNKLRTTFAHSIMLLVTSKAMTIGLLKGHSRCRPYCV